MPSLQAFTDTATLAQQEQAAVRGGNTYLLAGLREAAQELYKYRDIHKGAKLRILVLTDGEDTSDDNPLKELGTLRDATIIMNVVVLGGAQAGDLAAISGYTGGLVLQPLTNEDLLNAFEAEALTKRNEAERELHTQLEIFIGDDLSEWQAILKGPDDAQVPTAGGGGG